MTTMKDLPPTNYQLEQGKKFFKVVGDSLNLDDIEETLSECDEAFEIWDNIATDEYERQGGTFGENDPNEPSDPQLFEDCQLYATILLSKLASKDSPFHKLD